MAAIIIDGIAIAKGITDDLTAKVKKTGRVPGIAVIRVGNDEASEVYVNRKVKKAAEIGFYSEKFELPEQTTENDLLRLIQQCNANPKLHGILVQLPLPDHINQFTVQKSVLPEKDVDGLNPVNLGNLLAGRPSIVSATPRGIMTLIKSVHDDVAGMHAVVIGRSVMVGKPVAQLLLMSNATVTLCHSQTEDLPQITRQADILVVAVGKPKFITQDMVKSNATVIDVGVNRLPDGSLCGDVSFEAVKNVAGFLSPVPGGVGPMTIASLMQNTYDAMLL